MQIIYNITVSGYSFQKQTEAKNTTDKEILKAILETSHFPKYTKKDIKDYIQQYKETRKIKICSNYYIDNIEIT